MTKLPLVLLLFAVLGCQALAPAAPPVIGEATSTLVLDGGSFLITLYFSSGEHPLEILVPNPTRRHGDKIELWSPDNSSPEKMRILWPSVEGHRLHRSLLAVQSSAQASDVTKQICAQLDDILLHPDRPWNTVRFPPFVLRKQDM